MNVEDDPCNHERKWEKELGKDAKKNPRGRKKEKENDTSDNYFAVQYFLTQWCVGLKVSSGEIF